MAIKNARLFQGVEELSITDGLTGLYLLRYSSSACAKSFTGRAHGRQLSLMILDIDHFKRFNDTYAIRRGHDPGDRRRARPRERTQSRPDGPLRGDEFIILLPTPRRRRRCCSRTPSPALSGSPSPGS